MSRYPEQRRASSAGIESLVCGVMVGIDVLNEQQRGLLAEWLPGARVVRDHGWGLVATTVLEVLQGADRFIVKAGGADDHHIAREVRAHREWLGPWVDAGRAPQLIAADGEAKLLVTRFLPGRLVLGTAYATDPEIYRQAGELLAALHSQVTRPGLVDPGYETAANAHTLAWLAKDHRIHPALATRLRAEIEAWPTPSAALVPTHGDWQPRNWLAEDVPGLGTEVRAIDFGRADLRPAMTDFVRLAGREFRSDPLLERAFGEGYGSDPRESEEWRRHRLREAVGTAVWAYQVGDEDFEAHGHGLLAELMT